ncbi:hypothetical protein MTR_1g057380 [Medicago truncatula]|uniref:Uncharacterized protein n=1 Tax=Medicago truncatula TaxID=3880 RepID=A0A072VJG1_MEDTR|nr:hypothetical protein MTR_1g057380 [Medicago truncatula]
MSKFRSIDSLCRWVFVMVENVDDDPVKEKLIFVDNFGDVTPSRVVDKPNIDGASIHVEASLHVDSGVVQLDFNKVDTT